MCTASSPTLQHQDFAAALGHGLLALMFLLPGAAGCPASGCGWRSPERGGGVRERFTGATGPPRCCPPHADQALEAS
jgi:hypothetical protein